MSTGNYQIGKRYSFSPYLNGKVPKGKRYLDGILLAVSPSGNGTLQTKTDDKWVVPLDNLIPYRKSK